LLGQHQQQHKQHQHKQHHHQNDRHQQQHHHLHSSSACSANNRQHDHAQSLSSAFYCGTSKPSSSATHWATTSRHH
jgi:hypothetical protein